MKNNKVIISMALVILLTLLFMNNQTDLLSAEKDTSKKGYLGVSIQELNRHLRKELKADFGVVITSIEEDSPADKDGLMEDDVIQKVNGIKIRRPSTLTRIIQKIKPGEKAKIVVIRDGKEKTVTVTIGKLKSSRSYSFSVGPNVNVFKWYGGGAYLGVNLHELNEDLAGYFGVKADEGVLILDVEEDSPAEKAGLKSGDVITKIDDESVSDPEDVQDIISELEEDDVIKIEIIRKNSKQTLEATLEEGKSRHKYLFSPDKKIEELKLKSKGDKSIDILLDNIEKNKNRNKIIIEKNKAITPLPKAI